MPEAEDKDVLERQIELERVKLERVRYEVLMKLMEMMAEQERRRIRGVETLSVLARGIYRQ